MVEIGAADKPVALLPTTIRDAERLQCLLHFPREADLLLQRFVSFVNLFGDALVAYAGQHQFRYVGGYADRAFDLPVRRVPREFRDAAPCIPPPDPCLMVNTVRDGLPRAHDLQFFFPGDSSHVVGEEVGVSPSYQIGWSAHPQFGCGRIVGEDKSAFPVFVVDVVRKVIDQRAKEIPILHSVHVRHFPAGDIHPYAYKPCRSAFFVFFQQTVHSDPSPRSRFLVEQTNLYAQGSCCRAIDIALYVCEKKGAIFLMDRVFRIHKNVGRFLPHRHAHHTDTLFGVINVAGGYIPAIHAFFCCFKRFAHDLPVEHAGDGVVCVAGKVLGHFFAFTLFIAFFQA